MRYRISVLVAAFIFTMLVVAVAYWILQWSYNDAFLLGIQTFVISIIAEIARFFFLKRKKTNTKA